MKKRDIWAVLLLPFITFGIYSIYWLVATKVEMNAKGAKIPTAWLLIIPLVNIWWLWKYSEGTDQITEGKMSGVLAFILLFFLGFIGEAIIQDSYNKTAAAPSAPAPVNNAPAAPAPSETPAPTASVPETPATEDKTPPANGPLVQ